MSSTRPIDKYCNLSMLVMYRKHHIAQLSIEEFHVPFDGTLDPRQPLGDLLVSDAMGSAGRNICCLGNVAKTCDKVNY
jgi:hypothetical protein